jgi:hypothetical protein
MKSKKTQDTRVYCDEAIKMLMPKELQLREIIFCTFLIRGCHPNLDILFQGADSDGSTYWENSAGLQDSKLMSCK